MPSTKSSVGSAPNRAWLCASEHRGETDGWRLQVEGKMRTALVDRERQQGKTRLAGPRSWCQEFPAKSSMLLRHSRAFFLVDRAQRTLGLRDRQQGWIELDESRIDRGMRGVAGIAARFYRNHGREFLVIESEKCPSAAKACRVLYVDFEAHPLGALVIALLVDGALALGHARLQHQQGFVWPCPGLYKSLVRHRIDKDIVEHVMARHLQSRVVTHIESGSEIDPLAIVLGQLQLAVSCIVWSFRGLAHGDRRTEKEPTE